MEASVKGPRVMAKHFEVESAEKGSPLQTKFNAFTKGKNITEVHAFAVEQNNGKLVGNLLYTLDESAGDQPRLYAKVIDGVEQGSEVQTKVNAFTKDKTLDVKAAHVGGDDSGKATIVLIYSQEGKGESSGEEAASE